MLKLNTTCPKITIQEYVHGTLYMKIGNILTLTIVSILVASCANKSTSLQNHNEQNISTNQLALLKQETELNNSFVINAKNQLLKLVGEKNFDNYITKHGILACNNDPNQSLCVLNFYLQEYYRLKYDGQIKKIVKENQIKRHIELSKINASKINIQNYCQLSADFINAIYLNDTVKISSYFQPLFKMSEQDIATLRTKVNKDGYSQFLINENPSILQEMKTDYVEKCLNDPKHNVINYFHIFR